MSRGGRSITSASLLVDLGVHPRIAMRIMRYADVSITMRCILR